jgi:radical SAM-linked protein
VLERAFSRGAIFDSWEECLRLDVWEEAFAFHGVDPARYLGTIPVSARLPWDHFDIGLEPFFLQREYQKALKNRLSPPCGKAAGMFIHHTNASEASADARRLVCYDCGVACDMGKMRSERLSFLQSMGAFEPDTASGPRLPLVSTHSDAEERSPELERPPQPGEKHERWRLSFEKLGASALLGHLDFMRELGRVIRRAGLRPLYSQGYSPKPRFTFGPALALGVASLDEKIEVDLIDAPASAEQILAQLGRASGAGLRFVRAERMEQGAPTLGAAVNGARYIIFFSQATQLDSAHLEAKIAAFLQRDRTVIKRMVKGIGRLIDVKSRVRALSVGGATARERIAAAGFIGRFSSIVADVDLGPDGSVKPGEIIEALLGDGEVPHQVIRDALLLRAATSTKPESLEISGVPVSAGVAP